MISTVASGKAQPLFSLVIPMLNEREGLRALFDRVALSIKDNGVDWEIVVIDDGSTDGTADAVKTELEKFDRWKLIELSRNFGQQPAYRAGIDYASGDAIIFLDADLQDPPELIPRLIEKWREGFQVVTGCRTSREETGLRRFFFDCFHKIFHHMTGRVMPINSGMFSLIDRVVINNLKSARENNLFIPALKCWYGYSQTTVEYARKQREVGDPKQSFRKLFRYALDGLFSFSDLPLQWIAATGGFICLISFAYAGILIVEKFLQIFGYFLELRVLGFTTLAVAIFCLSGVQLLSLGIIGQYLARVYRESKGRPVYVVSKTSDSSSGVPLE